MGQPEDHRVMRQRREYGRGKAGPRVKVAGAGKRSDYQKNQVRLDERPQEGRPDSVITQ